MFLQIVYVIRDPRDVCISYYHHCRIFKYEDFQGTFDQFVDAFIEGAGVASEMSFVEQYYKSFEIIPYTVSND